MSNKEFSAKEVAIAILDKAASVLAKNLTEDKPKVLAEVRAEMGEAPIVTAKADPMSQNAAQMAEVDVPQPKAPPAEEKVIAKRPLQLKKFMENVANKKAGKV